MSRGWSRVREAKAAEVGVVSVRRPVGYLGCGSRLLPSPRARKMAAGVGEGRS